MGKLNVAIVDDNERMLQLLGELVSNDKDLHVVGTAKDGEEAYELIKEKEPDVVLLDIIMPVLDGIESTIKIRELEREHTKNIPIIGITANAYSCDEEKSISAGMNAHISKPVIEEKLIKEIKRLL